MEHILFAMENSTWGKSSQQPIWRAWIEPPRICGRNVPFMLRYVRDVVEEHGLSWKETGEKIYRFADRYYVVTPVGDGEYDIALCGSADPAAVQVAEAIEDLIHQGDAEIDEALSREMIDEIASAVGGVYSVDERFIQSVRDHIEDWLEYRGPDEYVRENGTWRRASNEDED